METREEVTHRARRRLNSAKAFCQLSWEEAFKSVDPRRLNHLSFGAFRRVVRRTLGVQERQLCDHDLRILFEVMDKDRSNSVDLSELLDFLAQGHRSPKEEELRADQKLRRAQRNLKMALQQTSKDKDFRKIFDRADLDDDNRMSSFEFQQYVRMTLKLSMWDLSSSDLNAIFSHLNRGGQGLTLQDLVEFVKASSDNHNRRDRSPSPFSFCEESAKTATFRRRPTLTYRQQLEGQGPPPQLSPLRRSTSCFVGLGRERRPGYRFSLSGDAMRYFEPERYAGFETEPR